MASPSLSPVNHNFWSVSLLGAISSLPSVSGHLALIRERIKSGSFFKSIMSCNAEDIKSMVDYWQNCNVPNLCSSHKETREASGAKGRLRMISDSKRTRP